MAKPLARVLALLDILQANISWLISSIYPDAFRFWERPGAVLAQPASLTSGNIPLFARHAGAAESQERIRLLGAARRGSALTV